MPLDRSPAQSAASRQNGTRSTGAATTVGKARAALNGVRHGLTSRTFFLLADEDPAEFQRHEALWLAAWRPRDLPEHEVATAAIRAMWREIRADRLEAQVLTDLFAAGEIPDEAEAHVAKDKAFKALGCLLRYKARIERERRAAMEALEGLRQRRLARPSEPEPAPPPTPTSKPSPLRSEPERSLNRHQRRALKAMERQRGRMAA